MARSIIDTFENKIGHTYQAIQNLSNKNTEYQKQSDYSQLMVTASSTFADISEVLNDLPPKIKNSRINEYTEKLVQSGCDKIEAKNAMSALFGEKQITKSMCEQVLCPYVKESMDLIKNDGYIDSQKIDNSISMNDQEFELSNELVHELKDMKKKESFMYKLFHKKEEQTLNNVPTNNIDNDLSIEKQDNPKRVQFSVKEAISVEASKSINIPEKTMQKTKEKTKSIDDVFKR